MSQSVVPQITVRVVLADADVAAFDPPPPLYIQVPRQSYLHGVLPTILPLWQRILPPRELTPWFEHRHLPLLWDVSFGVIYDLLVTEPEVQRPWNVTLHVTGFPSTILPQYTGVNCARGALMHSLKEAAFITTGTAKNVAMGMVQAALDEFWESVQKADLNAHKEMLERVEVPVPLPATVHSHRAERGLRVPVRIYARKGEGGMSGYGGLWRASRPLPALASNGSPVTLREALAPVLAKWLGMELEDSGDRRSRSSDGMDAVYSNVKKVVVGGAVLDDLGAKLLELHREFYGPDYFLYIVVQLHKHVDA